MPVWISGTATSAQATACSCEFRDTANLLCVYVPQQFAQFQMVQRQRHLKETLVGSSNGSSWMNGMVRIVSGS